MNKAKTILVTGGAGYIGSHACVELLGAGYEVVAVDNLCNSSEKAIARVQALAGRPLRFYKADLRDREAMEGVFQSNRIEAVIHFAGLKAVGESVAMPLEYYQNNVAGTLALCEVMRGHGVKTLIFSSSATVYGDPARVPIAEEAPLSAASPYGRTKLIIEDLLRDVRASDAEWNIMLLRYFNPVGAHPSGRIGEDPRGAPNNLMPYVAQTALGRRPEVRIFGRDYPTPDGTGVRDYLHVVDLALGHLKALEAMFQKPGLGVYNLGTGRGYSVLELIQAFERASGKKIPHRFVERRPGDVAVCYADPSRARRELGWSAERGLDAMCADAWRWQTAHPEGYGG